jgi:hypothetical protein
MFTVLFTLYSIIEQKRNILRDDFSFALEKRDEHVLEYRKQLEELQKQKNP